MQAPTRCMKVSSDLRLHLHAHVHINLEHRIPGGGVGGVCPEETVPSRTTEAASAANDRQLPDTVEDNVPGEYGHGAAVLTLCREHEIGSEQQRVLCHRRELKRTTVPCRRRGTPRLAPSSAGHR